MEKSVYVNVPKPKKISAIILAGGQGNRFHGKKQFTTVQGRPMWEYPYAAAVAALGEERVKIVGIEIPGGRTRTESVIRGMEAVDADTERIVIVEAARPLVTETEIRQLMEDPSPSSTFVRPLVNTVIFRDGTYLDRNALYELLTPQAFDYPLLREALQSGRFTDMTDETRVMFEYHGIPPHFLETTAPLFKVTYPQDLSIVETMMYQTD